MHQETRPGVTLREQVSSYLLALAGGQMAPKGFTWDFAEKVLAYIAELENKAWVGQPEGGILAEAEDLTNNARRSAYGHPLDDFTRTGRIWGALLHLDHDIPAETVGLMMACMKANRQTNSPKRDNLVDGAGYFNTVDMCIQERARREQATDDKWVTAAVAALAVDAMDPAQR